MYITKDLTQGNKESFDWSQYLPNKNSVLEIENPSDILSEARKILKENGFNMTIAFSKVMNELLLGIEIKNPQIVELGAATGFMSKWLLNKFGGNALLIDNSKESYDTFLQDSKNYKNITYRLHDIFKLPQDTKYDITCSFGLIEHFSDKTEVMKVHKDLLTAEGISIIVVPLDTPLTRLFYQIHPELNLGYRELLTEQEFKKIIVDNGLRILNTAVTKNYVYDFGAIACKF